MSLYLARLQSLTAGILTNENEKIIRAAPCFDWSKNMPYKAFENWIILKGGQIQKLDWDEKNGRLRQPPS